MIVVVEGPSAAGKTACALRLTTVAFVPENAGIAPAPSASSAEVASFWADANVRRWQQALAVEAKTGLAVCDTDPLKLHYDYCLFRVGECSRDTVLEGVQACRRRIAACELGIADRIFCRIPDHNTLRAQRDGDPFRPRRNFEAHALLAEPLRAWYQALADLDPGRVDWSFPDIAPPPTPARDRDDTALFDQWMAALDLD